MAEIDTLPIVNAIQNLKESNSENRQRLQKSLRAGLLNVVKSVDRINSSIISTMSARKDPFEQGQDFAQQMERSNTTTLAEFAQIAQAFLQFGTRENTALQAKLSGQVEEQTEVMAIAQQGQTQLFATMGKMLGQMNAKLADIAAHGLRQVQFLKLQLQERMNPALVTDQIRSELARDMGISIEKTLSRQKAREGYSEQLIMELEAVVRRVNQALGLQTAATLKMEDGYEDAAEDISTTVSTNTQETAKNTKAINNNTKSEARQESWLVKLHKIIKKDLIDNLKDMTKNFKSGMFGGALAGAGIGGALFGPMGVAGGALIGSGVGGLFSMIASRAAMAVLLNPYVLAAATAATAGYFGLEEFKKQQEQRMQDFPEETSWQAGTNVAGDWTAESLGWLLGKPNDYLNELLFGQKTNTEAAIENATRAAFEKVAENIGDLQKWIEEQPNPFTESRDGIDRGWLGNYWDNLKRDLESISQSIQQWILDELDATRNGLKQLWNESWGPGLTGLYFRVPKKPKVPAEPPEPGSDVPTLPPITPPAQKNPAPVIDKQSKIMLQNFARGNYSPAAAATPPSMINNMFDNRVNRSYYAEIDAGKYSPTTQPDPFSNFYGTYGFK